MKPGDKVWWFDAMTQTIEYSTVKEVANKVIYTYNKSFWLGVDGFSTREALCEHYRKIFE